MKGIPKEERPSAETTLRVASVFELAAAGEEQATCPNEPKLAGVLASIAPSAVKTHDARAEGAV